MRAAVGAAPLTGAAASPGAAAPAGAATSPGATAPAGAAACAAATVAAALVGVALALSLASCTNKPFNPASFSNTRPVASISVPSPVITGSESYNHQTFYWSGTDRDGFIVGFHVAIGDSNSSPTSWVFTTHDESTATYRTNIAGRVWPTLYVVAQDDRGALSDTAKTIFPLRNFPPSIVLRLNFKPPVSSFGAASFELVGFDDDGDETLQHLVDYRYDGSDPQVVFQPGDPAADPALGWVRLDTAPTSISLALRKIPAGSPQHLFVRIFDEAGAPGIFTYGWTVNEVRGQILLIDDCIHDSRDAFYRDAMQSVTGGDYSVWDIGGGLPTRDADIRLTFSQFPLLVWYTSNSPFSVNLRRSQSILTDYLTQDQDPDTPGVQHGRLLLEDSQVFGNTGLSSSFRANVLGIEDNLSEPRSQLAVYNSAMEAAIGTLDIAAQEAALPNLVSAGQNYFGGAGRYSGLYGLVAKAGTGPLYRFERTTLWAPSDNACRLAPGCAPLLAVRRPATGRADVVLFAFQLEWANASSNAFDALRALIQQDLQIGGP